MKPTLKTEKPKDPVLNFNAQRPNEPEMASAIRETALVSAVGFVVMDMVVADEDLTPQADADFTFIA